MRYQRCCSGDCGVRESSDVTKQFQVHQTSFCSQGTPDPPLDPGEDDELDQPLDENCLCLCHNPVWWELTEYLGFQQYKFDGSDGFTHPSSFGQSSDSGDHKSLWYFSGQQYKTEPHELCVVTSECKLLVCQCSEYEHLHHIILHPLSLGSRSL